MTSRFAQWTLDVRDGRDGGVLVAGPRDGIDVDGNTHLRPPGGDGLIVWLRASAGPKDGKNRNHPDLRTDDVEVEVERVLALGDPGRRRAE